jgi:molybdenum-dependent DNA-binding transcriptional regulator ModE
VAIGSPRDRVRVGRYPPLRLVIDACGGCEELGEEVMEILEAFDLTGTLRGAAQLAGCDHKTVAY